MTLPALATALLLSPAPAPAAPPRIEQSAGAELADPLADPATTPVPPAATRPRHAPGDPFEKLNRSVFRRYMAFDRHFLRAVALGYKHAVPRPARTGLRNFFQNLGEPLVFINYLLQLKPGKAVETAGRFLINSTLGVGGVIDVAAQPAIKLPHRPNGLGDTLGYYGVKPGPYLFLPVVGPTTLRDLLGGQAEAVATPFVIGTPFDRAEYQVTRAVTTGLDARVESDQDLDVLLRDAVDPYATFRSAFLQDRAGEIANLHGRKADATPGAELGDPLADPAEGGPTRPAASAPKPVGATSELGDPLTDPAPAGALPTDGSKAASSTDPVGSPSK